MTKSARGKKGAKSTARASSASKSTHHGAKKRSRAPEKPPTDRCPACMRSGETTDAGFLCSNEHCENFPGNLEAGELEAHDKAASRLTMGDSDIDPEVNDSLWRRGVMFHLLDDAQKELYDAWYSYPVSKRLVVAMISRRFGKTTVYGGLAIERAMQLEAAILHYAAMTTVQVRSMLIPVFQTILSTCPDDIKPFLRLRDSTWVFEENGSRIVMGGAEDEQKCDRFRGPPSDGWYIDEAGYIKCLKYLVNSVATPMLLGRPGARITMYSNAPYAPSHDMVGFVEKAQMQGTYSHRTIYDSPRYSPQEIEEFAESAGGKDSTEWRREYLAEIVVDEDHAVIPEWLTRATSMWVRQEDTFRARLPEPLDDESEIREPLVREVERPPHFDIYTTLDLGFAPDLTAGLTGYADYVADRLVIENEFTLFRATTDKVNEALDQMEKETWSDYWEWQARNYGKEAKPYLRVMDVDKQMQADLAVLHGMHFVIANNKDLQSQVNRLRQGVKHGKVVVNPRCEELIAHLGAAYWDNARRYFGRPNKKPTHGERYYGHFDLLSALLLMYAHWVRTHDPYPEMPVGISHQTHHISRRAIEARRKPDGITKLADMMNRKLSLQLRGTHYGR